MNQPMSAAQVAQQNRRDRAGRYTEQAATDPGSDVLASTGRWTSYEDATPDDVGDGQQWTPYFPGAAPKFGPAPEPDDIYVSRWNRTVAFRDDPTVKTEPAVSLQRFIRTNWRPDLGTEASRRRMAARFAAETAAIDHILLARGKRFSELPLRQQTVVARMRAKAHLYRAMETGELGQWDNARRYADEADKAAQAERDAMNPLQRWWADRH